VLVACGVNTQTGGVAAVLGIAAIVCVAAAVGGEMFQDLKAGHIIGGTPWKMQVGDIIGVFISGLVMFGVLLILHPGDVSKGLAEGYEGGFGSKHLPAPQAGLMAALSKGIIAGDMTWGLIIAGMVLGISFIMMGIKSPMLIFVGMYLPFETVFAIFAGGLIKGVLDFYAARRKYNAQQLAVTENIGILLASGLIAGEALMGLVTASFAIFEKHFSQMLPITHSSYIIGLVVLLAIGYLLVSIPLKRAQKVK
jgi:putative OPT family oligopeptide transporter